MDKSGGFVKRGDKQVLEVLVLRRKADGRCLLPGNFMASPKDVVPASVLAMISRALAQKV